LRKRAKKVFFGKETLKSYEKEIKGYDRRNFI
jgi:hypothetical protein